MFEETLLPVLLVVAAQTLAALKAWREVRLVLIFMASQTFLGRELRKVVFDIVLAFGNVAALAAFLRVGPDQGIPRLASVIEFLDALPGFGDMATPAVLRLKLGRLEEVDVVFRMTAQASPALLAEELRFILSGHLLRTFLRMAARTFRTRMRTVEDIAGPRVIEVLLIEGVDDVVSAFVLLVAIDTGLAVHKTVEMLLHLDVGIDVLVAIQTLGIRHAAARLVAFQTVFVLEILMPEDQRSRREEFVQEALELLLVATLGQGEATGQGTDEKHEDDEDLPHS